MTINCFPRWFCLHNSSSSDVSNYEFVMARLFICQTLIAEFLFQSELLAAEINYMAKRVIHTCYLHA
jgi:hypothetical protein